MVSEIAQKEITCQKFKQVHGNSAKVNRSLEVDVSFQEVFTLNHCAQISLPSR